MRITNVRRARVAAGCAAMALLALAAVAIAVSGGDPRQPTSSRSPLLEIGQPITPYRAGRPAKGWIEMRVRDPGGGEQVVRHHELTTPRGDRLSCAQVGRERSLRRAHVGKTGGCVPVSWEGRFALAYGVSQGKVVLISGQAMRQVRRVVIEGPGGTYEVPLSRHRAFVVIYSAKARGTATLTAHMRDGSTRFYRAELQSDYSQPGAAEARDPGSRPPWHVSATREPPGPRKGQTCARFESGVRPSSGVSFEAPAPMCGDLTRNVVFADAWRYGPRPGRHASSPGPRSPKRLIVWGAVADSVRGVRILGPGGTRTPRLSALGRAFMVVYPASVAPQEITLEVTRVDGTVDRHVAPRRLNTVVTRRAKSARAPRRG